MFVGRAKKRDFRTIHDINNSAMNLLKAVRWSREQVYNQIFSDEIRANGGAHTTLYVTVKDNGSDRYLESNVQHKYNKCPALMFHGTIYQGRKGPAVFWEKAWGSIDSAKYN